MTFRAPVDDILFTMAHAAGMERGIADGLYADLADGTARSVLEEAAKYAEGVLEPINRIGDQEGCRLADGVVTTPTGWKDAYKAWVEGGWQGLPAPSEAGGMGLPSLLHAACMDMWGAGNMAFMLGPVLSYGAVDALVAHGSPELQAKYVSRIVSGEWPATMNLTEPQAGSDLNALRSRAEPVGDGTYRITGQKIYITYGEHDLSDNIIHLVLARLPDAPFGTKGISLFLVPKFLVNDDGSLGARNDLRCTGLEHKMGIHGSPTCSMSYGDNGGAIGWLVGEENRGLACMFTMMNNARLATALQGVSVGEASFQKALAYANERRQGRAPGWSGEGMSPIVLHPDVQRMLLTMKAQTSAARSICYMVAESIDRAHRATDPAERKAAADRTALLTPVAKAFSTDSGNEISSLGVQVHGGMGYIEETGAAQYMRDARIAGIYEGTNGIQAIDLVTRKLPLQGGEVVRREIATMRATVDAVRAANAPVFGAMAARLGEAVDALERATTFQLEALGKAPASALAGATPYLRLFALARGGASLADMALAAHRLSAAGDTDPAHAGRITLARFWAETAVVAASGLEAQVTAGADALAGAETLLQVA